MKKLEWCITYFLKVSGISTNQSIRNTNFQAGCVQCVIFCNVLLFLEKLVLQWIPALVQEQTVIPHLWCQSFQTTMSIFTELVFFLFKRFVLDTYLCAICTKCRVWWYAHKRGAWMSHYKIDVRVFQSSRCNQSVLMTTLMVFKKVELTIQQMLLKNHFQKMIL